MIKNRDACEETYRDVQRLLFKIIHNFQAKHGGDWDDLMSVADEAFVVAYQTYRPERAQFTTWLQTKVYWALHSHLRDTIQHQDRPLTVPESDHPQVVA